MEISLYLFFSFYSVVSAENSLRVSSYKNDGGFYRLYNQLVIFLQNIIGQYSC